MTNYRRRQSYGLEELWAALDANRCMFTRAAREGRASMGFTEQDGNDCLKSLSKGHFIKGEPDKGGHHGVFHDQYSILLDGHHIFIKFYRLAEDQPVIVSSFKTDTGYDF